MRCGALENVPAQTDFIYLFIYVFTFFSDAEWEGLLSPGAHGVTLSMQARRSGRHGSKGNRRGNEPLPLQRNKTTLTGTLMLMGKGGEMERRG